MHMDIFNDDAFSAVTMTAALEDFEFTPGLISSLNLFEDVPTSTTSVSVEKRGNTFELIGTSERGEPIDEGTRDGRDLRVFNTTRIAKGHTIQASEIQNVRAFGEESDLETMISLCWPLSAAPAYFGRSNLGVPAARRVLRQGFGQGRHRHLRLVPRMEYYQAGRN